MHRFNIWTKLKENPEDGERRRVREDITCYMCTLIIDHKRPIIYGLNKFFIHGK